MTATSEAEREIEEIEREEEATYVAPTEREGPWLRDNAPLLYTPILVVVSSLLLWWYVSSADMTFQQRSALDWSAKLQPQIIEHVELTLWSTLIVLVIAIPLGILLTRPRFRGLAGPFLTVANIGQSVPAYGLFVLFFMWIGTGTFTAVLALAFFTILPVLRNTMVGLDQVDRAVIEAGRGMGLTKGQALRQIELPLSVPIMLAGVRTALVINVGMAALAFLIGGGGLGITINSGLSNQQDLVIITGAALTAILALTIDWLGAVAERILRPKGL